MVQLASGGRRIPRYPTKAAQSDIGHAQFVSTAYWIPNYNSEEKKIKFQIFVDTVSNGTDYFLFYCLLKCLCEKIDTLDCERAHFWEELVHTQPTHGRGGIKTS